MQSGTIDVANAGGWSEIAHALTWTLVHSLWVGASVALCLYGLLRLVDARRARWRYAASTGAFLSVPLVALWTLTREWNADASELWILLDASCAEGPSAQSTLLGSLGLLLAWADGLRALLARELAPLENALALSWITLASLALARFAGGWALVQHDSSRELRRASAQVQVRVAALARRIGLRGRVRAYWSARAPVPMVVGVLQPKIVIPTFLAPEVERGALDLVLLHELAHVRRRDPALRALEAFLHALFVFHPILPWIASRVAREREHCCDDLALEAGGDRLGYVRSLAALESSRCERADRPQRPRNWWRPMLGRRAALHATDGPLVERIRRLTSLAPRAPRSTLAGACGVLFLGSAGLAMGVLPTHDARPGTPITVGRSVSIASDVELNWTSAPPDFDALEPGRGVGMLVIAHELEPGLRTTLQRAEFVRLRVDGDAEFVRGFPLDGAVAADSGKRLIRIRAVRPSR